MLLQSNALFRNSENEEIFYQNFTCQGFSYVIILGLFPSKDMQTSPPPLSFDPVLMDDAECAE